MSGKLLWTGLWIAVCGAALGFPAAAIVGAVVMLIGLILLWLDK